MALYNKIHAAIELSTRIIPIKRVERRPVDQPKRESRHSKRDQTQFLLQTWSRQDLKELYKIRQFGNGTPEILVDINKVNKLFFDDPHTVLRRGICYMSQCTALLLLCFARKKMTSGDQAVSMMMSVSDSLVMNNLANAFLLNVAKIRDPYHNALRELLVSGWSLKDFGENNHDRLRKSRRILIISKEPNEKSGNLKKRRLVLASSKGPNKQSGQYEPGNAPTREKNPK